MNMRLEDAQALAELLLEKHELRHWKFRFDNARTRNGLCRYSAMTIQLSAPRTLTRDEAAVENTILHEIAHALVGSGHHHDYTWEKMAKAIGCDGRRCSADVVQVSSKWTGYCPHCPKTFPFHRRPKRNHLHTDCYKRLGRTNCKPLVIGLSGARTMAAAAERSERGTI